MTFTKADEVPPCYSHKEPELWFPVHEDEGAEAIAICNECPMQDRCLETVKSYPRKDRFGIWGGVDFTPRGKVAERVDA